MLDALQLTAKKEKERETEMEHMSHNFAKYRRDISASRKAWSAS
jgi:hypothetical protein